jgi:hypothetical protein
MSMSDRRENSVLFSLRELRSIEDDRVKQEEVAEQQRIEAERKAREDEIRRAKEAEEAKIRAAEDRVRKEREDKERAEREGQLRLQESERRAQIEAAARLEQTRIEAEARARIEGKKFPTGLVVGSLVGLIALSVGVVSYLVHEHNIELASAQAAAQAKSDAEKKALIAAQDAEDRKNAAELADLKAQLDKATTDADRAKIKAAMVATAEKREHHGSSSASKGETKPKGTRVNTKTNDPLGGLDL